MEDTLRRIAAALERLAPLTSPPPPDDLPAYHWRHGALTGADFNPLPLELLTGIDPQKAAALANVRRLASGFAAHDMLLWGARGSGKSALVKSVVGEVQATATGAAGGLALIEFADGAADTLPQLFAQLGRWNRPVLVFIDDIGFDDDMAAARVLRSVLDGGSTARPAHVRLAVTSNRRHIVARDLAEQESAINVRDVVDDRLALADRFGLALGFHVADQPTYLAMVGRYAGHHGLPFDPADAVQFATQRGSRSGRVAWHYIVELAGRNERTL